MAEKPESIPEWSARLIKRRRPPARAVAARVPDALADEFFEVAQRVGVKRNDVIRQAVEDFVARHRATCDREKRVA